MLFLTVDEVLAQASAELALPTATFASTDATSTQLVALLGKAGRELARLDWSQLTVRYTLSPSATGPYALPADFRSVVPQTAWDTTTSIPLVGPLSEQQWEAYKARNVSPAVGTPFRVWLNKLYLFPETNFPTGKTIAFEYRITSWVLTDPAGSYPDDSVPGSGADVVWFDFPLIVAALKVAWKREKGFDSTAAQEDFDVLLKAARDDNADAPVLSLNSGSGGRLIGLSNLPDSGYNA